MKRAQILTLAVAAFNKMASATQLNFSTYTTKDTTIYITADLSGASGTINLVDANTKKLEGVTNLDGEGQLAKGRFIVFDSIRGLVERLAEEFGKAMWKGEAPAALKNASLKISQGQDILYIPMTDLLNNYTSTSNDDDYRELSHMPMLLDQKEYTIQLIFPKGESVVTGVDNSCLLRLEMRATEFFVR